MTNPAQEAFEKWWNDKGSGYAPQPNYDMEEHAKAVSDLAYQASRQDSMAMIAELVGALQQASIHIGYLAAGAEEDKATVASVLTKAEKFMEEV